MRLSDLEEKGFPSIDQTVKNLKGKLDKTGQKPADVMKDPRAGMSKPGAGTGPSMQMKMNVPQKSITMKNPQGGMARSMGGT
tara:strand:- start:351 stop:596 length:246 start_codon:yes stop_codon:yes gene_type:complete